MKDPTPLEFGCNASTWNTRMKPALGFQTYDAQHLLSHVQAIG
jgi:hypothetical protein